jgi:hypothetical protein
MQNITSLIINTICTNTANAPKRKLSILEVSEVVAYIFSNDRVVDYIIGNIWKKNHLNALKIKTTTKILYLIAPILINENEMFFKKCKSYHQ